MPIFDLRTAANGPGETILEDQEIIDFPDFNGF
jgi:hypothetical protein